LAVVDLLRPRAANPVQRTRRHVAAHEVVAPDEYVLHNRHLIEQRQVLESATDTEIGTGYRRRGGDVVILEQDPAAVRLAVTGDAVEKRRLAPAL
jgi:hypothetical protein